MIILIKFEESIHKEPLENRLSWATEITLLYIVGFQKFNVFCK